MKIIHIGPDSQFIQFASQIFEEAAPGCNEYIITSHAATLKYKPNTKFLTILEPKNSSILRLPSLLKEADAIIAHGLDLFAIIAFLIARKNAVRVWSGWGFDYYGLKNSSNTPLLGERTIQLQRQIASKKLTNISAKLNSILSKKLKHFAVAKTSLFSAPIKSDYAILQEAFPVFTGKYAQINYGDVKSTFAAGAESISGCNILLGNSASYTNNHIEAFEILSSMNLQNRKVIVPLSYGDDKYKDAIIREGERILGNSFRPLKDFMPLHEYVETVASCSIVIMNHRRQQALGNIGAALFHGARVYLDDRNPVYQFFKDQNANIESLQSLQGTFFPTENLTPEEINNNRNILELHWGRNTVSSNVKSLIDEILSVSHGSQFSTR